MDGSPRRTSTEKKWERKGGREGEEGGKGSAHLYILKVLGGLAVIHLDCIVEDDQRIAGEEMGHMPGERRVHSTF